MARARIKALRSDIELQSVLRYRQVRSRCENGEVHIDGLGGAAIDLAPVPNFDDFNCARSIIDGVDDATLTLSKAKSPFSAR